MILLAILGFGMLMGWLAQLALGMGTRPNAESLVAGLAGSFVGGMLGSLVFDGDLALHPSGFIGTFVGAVVVLAVWGVVRGRAAR